jgi:hypothetical protein
MRLGRDRAGELADGGGGPAAGRRAGARLRRNAQRLLANAGLIATCAVLVVAGAGRRPSDFDIALLLGVARVTLLARLPSRADLRVGGWRWSVVASSHLQSSAPRDSRASTGQRAAR